MAAINDVMGAIRLLESGTVTGRYTQVKAGGRILGAYGISRDNWTRWTRELGLDGADWRDKKAQDTVVRTKLGQFYNRYRDWLAVTAAWFGGSGAAEAYLERGLEGVNSALRTDINKVAQFIDETPGPGTREAELERTRQEEALADLPSAPRPRTTTINVDVPVTGIIDLQRRSAGIEPPDPARVAQLRASEMHKSVSRAFQGLSNAIRRGAGGLIEASSALTAEQKAALQTGEPEEDEGEAPRG